MTKPKNKTFSTRVSTDCYNLIKYYIEKGVEARPLTETAVAVISKLFAKWRRQQTDRGQSKDFATDFKEFSEQFKN